MPVCLDWAPAAAAGDVDGGGGGVGPADLANLLAGCQNSLRMFGDKSSDPNRTKTTKKMMKGQHFLH